MAEQPSKEESSELSRLRALVSTLEEERDIARAMNARSICVWCGTITPFPNGPDTTPEERVRVMWEHAEGCDQRPERRLADEIERMVLVLKAACDREWGDETPEQVATIAANAIHWREQGKATAEAELERVRSERNEFHRALIDTQGDLTQLRTALEGLRDEWRKDVMSEDGHVYIDLKRCADELDALLSAPDLGGTRWKCRACPATWVAAECLPCPGCGSKGGVRASTTT